MITELLIGIGILAILILIFVVYLIISYILLDREEERKARYSYFEEGDISKLMERRLKR